MNQKPTVKSSRRPIGISRARAAAIALAKTARELLVCEVTAELPGRCLVYSRVPSPKSCWYVLCGPRQVNATGETRILLCISRRSGRILLVEQLGGE